MYRIKVSCLKLAICYMITVRLCTDFNWGLAYITVLSITTVRTLIPYYKWGSKYSFELRIGQYPCTKYYYSNRISSYYNWGNKCSFEVGIGICHCTQYYSSNSLSSLVHGVTFHYFMYIYTNDIWKWQRAGGLQCWW